MSFDLERVRAGRKPFTAVDLRLSSCNKVYGEGFCTAAIGTTGEEECFNTRGSCQDPANFDLLEARDFTGTSTEALTRSSALTGASTASKQGRFIGIFRADTIDGTNGNDLLHASNSGGTEEFYVGLETDGRFRLYIEDGTGLLVSFFTSISTPLVVDEWYLVAISWDLTAGVNAVKITVNGEDYTLSNASTDRAIDWSLFDTWRIGGDTTTAWDGGIALVYFEDDAFTDWSQPFSNKAIVDNTVIQPLERGLGDGQPLIYMRGNHVQFLENQGTGGSFTDGTSPATYAEQTPYLAGEVLELRFYQNQGRVPAGIGANAFPFLETVSITPSKLEIKKAVGVRGKASMRFTDGPHHDRGIDPYVDNRSYDPFTRGTFWTKLIARHQYYIGREVIIYSGYLDESGAFDLDNFQARTYRIDTIDGPSLGGTVGLTAKDLLDFAASKRTKVPVEAPGGLSADLTTAASSFDVTPTGAGAEYATSGFVRINREIIKFTRSGDTFTINARGQFNTQNVAHGADDSVQPCYDFAAQGAGGSKPVQDIVYDLMLKVPGITPINIDKAAWDAEDFPNLFSGIVTEPEGVTDLSNELGDAAGFYLWPDDRTNLIELRKIQPASAAERTLSDDSSWAKKSVEVKRLVDERISRTVVYAGQQDPTEKLDLKSNYSLIEAVISDVESPQKIPIPVTKEIFSRWILGTGRAQATEVATRFNERFGEPPIGLTAEIDAKDIDLWLGDLFVGRHQQILKMDGTPASLSYLITQIKETEQGTKYRVEAVEEKYSFDPGEERLVEFEDLTPGPINARTEHDKIYTAPTGNETVRFRVPAGFYCGALQVLDEDWPSGTTIILELEDGATMAGAGGRGSIFGGSGSDGQDGLVVTRAITLDYSSASASTPAVVAGGGGGGGTGFDTVGGNLVSASGGGGAGVPGGLAGIGDDTSIGIPSNPGSESGGGGGGQVGTAQGGDGGGLATAGQDGQNATNTPGGQPGVGINGHSFITYVGTNLTVLGGSIN